MALQLEQVTINGDHLSVPNITLKPRFTGVSQVFCFQVQECQSDGKPIVETLNRLLSMPMVQLVS